MGDNLSRQQWSGLFPTTANPNIVEKLFNSLREKYVEPQRHYHTTRHISACLRHFDAVRHLLANPRAVARAIWFHDAIYFPRRTDNEAASAEFAAGALAALGVPAPEIAAVRRLILVTAHTSVPQTTDEQFLVDLDLAILGSSPAEFAAYERQIRREYQWAAADIFRQKRGELLRQFLRRPAIFHTHYFWAKLETRARKNLTQALEDYP